MSIVTINTRAIMHEIINNNFSGKDIKYMLNESSTKRLDQLVWYAYKLEKEGFKVYIEVKFNSDYSDRERRLEIVSEKDKSFNIYKFSNIKKFDKDAIALDRIISELKDKYVIALHITGVLLLDSSADIDFLNSKIKSISNQLVIKTI